MALEIKGAEEIRKKLARAGDTVLPALVPVVLKRTQVIAAKASATVPRDTNELAASAFTDDPEINRRAQSATGTTGYEADHAPFVHEGFHFGKKDGDPPKWLERAADGEEAVLAEEVGDALMAALAKL